MMKRPRIWRPSRRRRWEDDLPGSRASDTTEYVERGYEKHFRRARKLRAPAAGEYSRVKWQNGDRKS